MVDAAKDDTEFGARKLSGVPMGLCEALPRLVDAANAKAAAPPELSSEVDNSDDVLGHTAGLPWARRETFITALEKATIDGELRLWLRLPDGHRFDLTAAEWRATPFRREIVITGFWRDTLGGLARYDDMPVFVDEAAFEAWCGERASVRRRDPCFGRALAICFDRTLSARPDQASGFFESGVGRSLGDLRTDKNRPRFRQCR